MIDNIIARLLLIMMLTLTLSAVSSAAANNESDGISEAVKLYAEALPLAVHSPKRKELLSKAESMLKKTIADNPKSLEAHRKLMGVYLLQQDYGKGIRTMQDAITLSPEDAKLFISLAFLYEHSGALQYAKAMLNHALELDPKQQIAKEYLTHIEKKIESANMQQAHHGQGTKDKMHGKPSHTIPHTAKAKLENESK